MGVGGAPRAVGGRVAGSPLREAEGIHPAAGHYARSSTDADFEFIFESTESWGSRTAPIRPDPHLASGGWRQKNEVGSGSCSRERVPAAR